MVLTSQVGTRLVQRNGGDGFIEFLDASLA